MPSELAVWAGPVATIVASLTAAGVTIVFNRRQAATAEAQKEIAASQRDIAHEKLKSDLFDRRFSIYVALRDGLLHCMRNARNCDYREVFRLTAPVEGAFFLFGDTNARYLLDLREKVIEYAADCEALKMLRQGENDYEEFIQRTGDGLRYISKEFPKLSKKIKDEIGVRDISTPLIGGPRQRRR